MKHVMSHVTQFRGTHYEYGYYLGNKLKHLPILTKRRKELKVHPRHFIIDEIKIEAIFKQFSLAIWQEILGLRDALEMDTASALREFAGYYFEYGKSGCSIITGENFFVRNYDHDPISYEGLYMLYQPTDQGYASIGPSMQITGRTDGINEKGLVIGYNFVNRLRSNDGFICNMINRLILENCATVTEAVELLKAIPHRHSFSYVLLDSSGQSIVVEASAHKVIAREGKISTNHFEKLTTENRYRMDDSLRRTNIMKHKKPELKTPYDAFRFMNDAEENVFSKKYGAWSGTIHTALYLPEKLQAWIAFGSGRLPIVIDFPQWLNGESLKITKLKGVLESTNGFLNEL